ncbi:hypothetical protein EVAR_17173_1 [Eumeta japonica]|uniref:Uncharacterized protein n=1 Tax=Eumeta variegata TaxID=151549 RepID=A0A4C1U924_EUMVA|nr:hypothetical protein EVAR_17173_1 [Eumeta japonica]
MIKTTLSELFSVHDDRSVAEDWLVIFLSASSSEIVELSLQIMVAVVCDKINAKEEELKATLANHLCCTSSDKKGRRLARKFMAIVNLKSLSFKLLRVADVGVRLPIQCLSLTLTYVIILLQFGKLIENSLFIEKK